MQKTLVADQEFYSTQKSDLNSKFKSCFNTIISNNEYLNEHDSVALDLFDELETLFDDIEKFSEGGQGEIKTAKDKKLQRYVALKSLKKDFLSNPAIVNNFILEARITAQLDHPSIIPMYGIIREPNSFVHMAMKLVQGVTLKEIIDDHLLECKSLKNKELSTFEHKALSERLAYFIKICEAISYAHNKGVIHRDLKPDNVMVGSFQEVYLMDWGIAKIMTDDQETIETQEGAPKGSVSGTPGFIAPEYIMSGHVQFASDQYALGAILYQLVTLRGHIEGKGEKQLLEKTLRAQLNPITHANSAIKIPRTIKAIICKTMAHDPSERYEKVELLAEDINNFLQGRETLALPDNSFRRLVRAIYRHKMITVISVLSLLLLLAGLTINSLYEQKKTAELAQHRELTLINFQSSLEQRASKIDGHFTKLSGILQRYSDKVNYLLQSPVEKNQQMKFFDYHDFKIKNENVLGLEPSNLYGHEVSVKSGNYKLAPGLKLSDSVRQLQSLSPVIDDILVYMAESSGYHAGDLSQELSEEIALNQGFAIRWVYSGLANGLLINYPGMGKLEKDYDVRTRFWFKHSQKQKQMFWSSPYIDLFGQGLVVSAVQPLYSKQQEFIGASAIDITFDYAYNTIMAASEDKKTGLVKNRYLIDKDGKVILSNVSEISNMKEAERDKTEIQFKDFPYLHLLNTISKKQSGQLKIKNQGQTKLIGFSPIPTLAWYYIEEVNFDELISH